MKRKTEEQLREVLARVPAPPEGSTFQIQDLRYVSLPHPYCLTPKHVEIASNHYGGVLSEEAIEGAEEHGARCGMGRPGSPVSGLSPCMLSCKEHEILLTLFVEVEMNHTLSDIPGLQPYLFQVKKWAEEENVGLDGFAFPQKEQR